MSFRIRAGAALVLVLGVIVVSLPARDASAAGPGRVDVRNLGTGPLQRAVVQWRRGDGAVARARRADQLAAAVPGLRTAAELGGDATAYWLPEARTRALAVRDLEALAAVDGVAEVAPDLRVTALLQPNDTYYAAYQADLYGSYGIDTPAAWDTTTGSPSVIVAVIDTGITTHSELTARVLPGYDFISDPLVANDGDGRDANPADPGDWVTAAESAAGYFEGCPATSSSWHGTHVSGTIAAGGNNTEGVAGIAWSSTILPVRVLGKCGGYSSDIAAAIRWAAGGSVPGVPDNPHPARVLNLSLGGAGVCESFTQDAIDDALGHGAAVVVAAGNSNDDVSGYEPAGCAGVISVAATTSAGKRASFSNYGAAVTIAAPGVTILSTDNNGTTVPGTETYGWGSGTSMAAPHVSGVAALVLAVDTGLAPDGLTSLLVDTAKAVAADGSGTGCQALGCGAGIVDAAGAVAAAAILPEPTPSPGASPTPSPGGSPPEDTTPPSIASFAASTGSPFSGSTVRFALRFDEPVSGLSADDLATAGTATGCVIGSPTGSTTSYAIAVTGCSEGTVSLALAALAVEDGSGNAGPVSEAATAAVVIDRTSPTASAPVARPLTGVTLSGPSLQVVLSWSGADTGGSGVASYEVARSTDGGDTWTLVGFGLASPSMTATVRSSGSVRFRVRAIDHAGNTSVWSTGPTLRARLIQQTSHAIDYRSTWRTSRASRYSGGSVRYAKASGARATLRFTGRSIALVTTRAATRGKVRIFVNGKRVATINLRATSTLARSVVWQRTWASVRTRTVRIEVVGTPGRPRVDLDAFATLR